MRLRTKLEALALAGSVVGLFLVATGPAHAGEQRGADHRHGHANRASPVGCGSPNLAGTGTTPYQQPVGPLNIYAASSPTEPSPTGYYGVSGTSGTNSAYAESAGAFSAPVPVGPVPAGPGPTGNVVLSGSVDGHSGTAGFGDDANGTGGTPIGTTGWYVCD